MTAASPSPIGPSVPTGVLVWGEALVVRAGLIAAAAVLLITVGAPLAAILVHSLEDRDGAFVGLVHFREYLTTPALHFAVGNTITFAMLATLITIPAAFLFAYAIQRSCMPWKGVFRNVALIPILAPSMLAALSFIYLFGNQGLLKSWLAFFGIKTIYGLPGMVLAMSFSAFPHALMILLASMALADARLYEAAEALRAGPVRKFFTITLPGAKYGLISASMVVFTMAVSEFGVPKVIGGNYEVMAVDIYKQVIGQQNFAKGAVVSLLLLLPALVAFVVDWVVQGRQRAQMSARSVPYAPRPSPWFDRAMLAWCLLVSAAMVVVMGMAVFASFIKLWPYNFSFSLRHYVYGLTEAGVDSAYLNSVTLAGGTALFGTVGVFLTAYWLEKTRGLAWLRPVIRLFAVLPMAVPGLVLGLGYIFFFNHPGNPLNVLYQTMPILIICTVVHFYASSHLTAVTALKALDGEFESVSASLKVPFWRTFRRVSVPVCLPSVLDVARYFFVNAMTTISAVVFLYSPRTVLASISIIQLDEAGEVGAAAAMATLIFATSAGFCILWAGVGRLVNRRTQAWRRPPETA